MNLTRVLKMIRISLRNFIIFESIKLMICLMISYEWTSYVHSMSFAVENPVPSSSSLILPSNNNSFASIYELGDGEIITKFRWKNFSAIETRYDHIDLFQMLNDKNQIIQFWLSNGELVDCEYTNDTKTTERFHREFQKINPNMKKDTKSFKLLEEHENLNNEDTGTLPDHLKRLADYERYREQCSQLHKKIQHLLEDKVGSSRKKGKGRKRKRSRTRRGILSFPGTKWCGKGSSNKDFEDLGDYSFADRCCRDHDQCKLSIGPFENQFYLFNYRFHYVSHCSCDERFRSCLKVANSGAANLVGKIFFNVVKTKCFMFVIDEMCTERSWWGNCIATKRRKRAVFRDPMEY